MSDIVGASFTALTVTVKVLLVVISPSETLTVMVAEPVLFAAGVIAIVLLAPDPPKTMPPAGISVVLDDVPVTVSEVTEASTSPIVNGIIGTAESSITV